MGGERERERERERESSDESQAWRQPLETDNGSLCSCK